MFGLILSVSYRVLPSFTGFYRVLLGFTEFDQGLPSFTGLSSASRCAQLKWNLMYRVLPGFTEFLDENSMASVEFFVFVLHSVDDSSRLTSTRQWLEPRGSHRVFFLPSFYRVFAFFLWLPAVLLTGRNWFVCGLVWHDVWWRMCRILEPAIRPVWLHSVPLCVQVCNTECVSVCVSL